MSMAKYSCGDAAAALRRSLIGTPECRDLSKVSPAQSWAEEIHEKDLFMCFDGNKAGNNNTMAKAFAGMSESGQRVALSGVQTQKTEYNL